MASLDNYIWNPDVIHVNLIGGPAGSGKSTLSRELVKLTDFDPIDKDTAAPLVEALNIQLGNPPDDRQSAEYIKIVRPAEYNFMKKAMLECVSLGRSVVADAPFGPEFSDETWRHNFEQDCVKAAKGKAVAVHYILVHVDDDVLRSRLDTRHDPRDADKLKNDEKWAQFLANARSFVPVEPYFRIDCSKDGAKETTACALKVIEALHLLPPLFSARPRLQRGWQAEVA